MKLATVLLLLAAAAAASCRPMPGGAGRNPCEYSAHDQCISETQYCQGKQLHTCGSGLRCNFNEQAIGCEPVDANQPDEELANPCEYSAHDQCISETQYCQGKQLHTCGAGLRCNFNEQAIGCEPDDSQ